MIPDRFVEQKYSSVNANCGLTLNTSAHLKHMWKLDLICIYG